MLEDDDWRGRLIDGRYMVESVLGKGGMGLVLKARHKFTGVEVEVKVLRPELQLDTEVQMRFLGEARAPNAIGHPGIVHRMRRRRALRPTGTPSPRLARGLPC